MWDMILIIALIGVVLFLVFRGRGRGGRDTELADAKAEARRWVERLGGQVLNLTGTNDAAKQALADASERYTAAGSQMDQATTTTQCRLATQTALEGLYYVRAARTAMDLDPGPELPEASGQRAAGQVVADRRVEVQGHTYAASPAAGAGTPYYYPGGMVAGRPVPQGWYSEPWWKTALVAGAWGVGSFVVMDALFSGGLGVGHDMGGHALDAGAGDLGGDLHSAGEDFGGDWGGDFGGDFF